MVDRSEREKLMVIAGLLTAVMLSKCGQQPVRAGHILTHAAGNDCFAFGGRIVGVPILVDADLHSRSSDFRMKLGAIQIIL